MIVRRRPDRGELVPAEPIRRGTCAPAVRRSVDSAGALLVALTLSACGGSDGVGPDPTVGAVVIQASRTILQVGETLQLIATVLDDNGQALQGRTLTWSSSDSVVASVTAGGLVRALGGGVATVTATGGGVSDSVTLAILGGPCQPEDAEPMTFGQALEDSLTVFDCSLFLADRSADLWEFMVAEPAGVVFTMTSDAFDPYLLIADVQGNLFTGDEARLLHWLDAGTYIVLATSLEGGSTGAYRLESETVEIAPCDAPVGSIALNEAVTDSLGLTSCVYKGAISESWSFNLAADARVSIALNSSDFDPFFEVTDSTGESVVFDNDGGEDGNSLIVEDFEAGDYTIWVSGVPQAGSYTLTVSEATP